MTSNTLSRYELITFDKEGGEVLTNCRVDDIEIDSLFGEGPYVSGFKLAPLSPSDKSIVDAYQVLAESCEKEHLAQCQKIEGVMIAEQLSIRL